MMVRLMLVHTIGLLQKERTTLPLAKSERNVEPLYFLIIYYLKGKAYDFYTQSVSLNPHEWTLKEFFVQLFNYCFSSDYRMELREKLRKCFQNNKTVSDYAFELKELFNMIGVVDE